MEQRASNLMLYTVGERKLDKTTSKILKVGTGGFSRKQTTCYRHGNNALGTAESFRRIADGDGNENRKRDNKVILIARKLNLQEVEKSRGITDRTLPQKSLLLPEGSFLSAFHSIWA